MKKILLASALLIGSLYAESHNLSTALSFKKDISIETFEVCDKDYMWKVVVQIETKKVIAFEQIQEERTGAIVLKKCPKK